MRPSLSATPDGAEKPPATCVHFAPSTFEYSARISAGGGSAPVFVPVAVSSCMRRELPVSAT